MEVSKILTGNYVSHLLLKIIEVGAGPYIGFPKCPNVEELRSVWDKSKNLNLHPMTVMASIMNDEKEALKFYSRCKLSNYDRNLLMFIVQKRAVKSEKFHYYKELYFKTEGKPSDVRVYIEELFKYFSDIGLLHEFKSWEPPEFPLNGNLLREWGVPQGRLMGFVMKLLKQEWLDSEFQKTEEDLHKSLPAILEELRQKKLEQKCK
jgi:hypothetical protein